MQDGTANIVNYGSAVTSIPSLGTGGGITDTTPRTYGRQILSGSIRGNQNITGSLTITNPNTNAQNISLDGSNQAIEVTNTDGSKVGMGLIPDGSNTFGFFSLNASGQLLMKIVGSTIYTYDLTQTPSVNNMQLLKLPDGNYGMVVAKVGSSVSSLFS
jgi:hypothetical protein